MLFILSIINGIIIFSLGVLVIKFRRDIKRWTGTMILVERYFGRGATYLVIILIGSGLMLYGFFWPFGANEMIFGEKEVTQNNIVEK